MGVWHMKSKLSKMVAGLALFFLLATPAPAAERQMLHGYVPAAVAQLNLQPLGRLPATNRLHIAFILPLRNNEALNKLFLQLYDPASTNFHHWLTPEQFTERFGPSVENYQAVVNSAEANGLKVTRPHPGRSVLGVDGSVADIEQALHVKMFQYQHPTEARRFFAPDTDPSLELKVPILAISGLNNYEVPHSTLSKAARMNSAGAGSGNSGEYLGTDFRNAYVPGVTNTGSGQVVGLVEANGSGFVGAGGYNPVDVQQYESLVGAPNIPLISVLQPNPPIPSGNDNNEFSLDVDMLIAMAPGISNINIYFPPDDMTSEEMYQEIAYPTLGEARPNQISTSWSYDTGPASTNLLMEMALQGQSFFKYSGDSGAWPVRTNDYPGFNYLTLVGGTELRMSGTGTSWTNETVWSGSSGGYFTSSVAIPFYQQGINMTINQGSTYGRNVPDVAMVADNIEIIASYQPTNGPLQEKLPVDVDGTSASTPLWAALTALVNEQAAAQGKPSVGFLNPALYAIAAGPSYTSCFHDITVGNNTNAASPNLFFAAPGYDLCTGLGSPNGANLINALVGFSGPVFVNFSYTGGTQNGAFYTPFKTLTAGVNAVSSGGTIFIETAGSSSETMTITKPMTVTAIDGSATIGN
jgi:subtilase family serine protease